MQEEVENRTVTLVINTTKLTTRTLKNAILKALAEMKKRREANKLPEIPHGKQTVKQLVGQNQAVANIEVTKKNIKSFERVARKYGVDFAVKKENRESVLKKLNHYKDIVKNTVVNRTRKKELER